MSEAIFLLLLLGFLGITTGSHASNIKGRHSIREFLKHLANLQIIIRLPEKVYTFSVEEERLALEQTLNHLRDNEDANVQIFSFLQHKSHSRKTIEIIFFSFS